MSTALSTLLSHIVDVIVGIVRATARPSLAVVLTLLHGQLHQFIQMTQSGLNAETNWKD